MRVKRALAAGLLVLGLASAGRADEMTQLSLLSDRAPALEAPIAPRPDAAVLQHSRRRSMTIVTGGDLGLNAHGQPVEPGGARRHGNYLPWDELTAGLRPLLDGDLNFANLETVVTGRNDLPAEAKHFNFRSHPLGVRHLARTGFNLLSTANNHAIDYGIAGMLETLGHLDTLEREGLVVAHAGVGANREAAARPKVFGLKAARVAFAAMGIDSGGRAGENRPGLMAWRAAEDVATVIQRLGDTPADYRILSVHHGQEREVATDRDAVVKLRLQAVGAGGIDLVVGHHAHVVQGVEITDGKLIFYGLGNLLHPGMQDMSGLGPCQDYGLLARIHLAGEAAGPLRMVAVEVIPLGRMHWAAEPLAAGPGGDRVHVLNHLAEALDDGRSGSRGLRFAPRADGSGLHCQPGADSEPGRVGALCAGFAGVPPTPQPLKARIASACGQGAAVAAGARFAPNPRMQPATAAPSRSSDWQRNVFSGN